MTRVTLAALLLTLLLAPHPALADQAAAPQPGREPVGRPDFFFGQPVGWIGARGSWVIERAGGDLFSFVRDQLTIGRRSFDRPTIAGELGIRIGPRVSAVIGAGWGRSSATSEYRHFIGTDDLPIQQTTALTQSDYTLSARFDLTPSGRRISRLAWIPNRFTPFVGGGVGMTYYDFSQHGEFVDYVDLGVFRSTFDSTGWTPNVHVLAGADIAVWRDLFVTFDARYLWAHASLGQDFTDFNGIDLSGFRWATGVNFVF